MPNAWSSTLRPVVALIALLVVAAYGSAASAEARPKPSIPVPDAVELERAVVALAHLGPAARAEAAALRRTERRLRGLARRTAPPGDRRERRRLRARRVALRAAADEARLGLASARASRRLVLATLPLEVRQRVLQRISRVRERGRASRTRTSSPVVRLALGAAVPGVPVARRTRAARASTPSGIGAVAAAYALTQIGTPYRARGASPGGYDCSGLVYWSFGRAGLTIPRSSGDIWAAGEPVPRRRAAPGDIVSFHGLGHVGIYLGGGLYVHSTESGDVVRVSALSERRDLDGFVRIRG